MALRRRERIMQPLSDPRPRGQLGGTEQPLRANSGSTKSYTARTCSVGVVGFGAANLKFSNFNAPLSSGHA